MESLLKNGCRVLCLSFCCGSMQAASATDRDLSLPDEIIIIGRDATWQLRQEMLSAEREAYNIFNQFNDEKRFITTCDKTQPTGTRFTYQSCQPEFVRRATADYARDHLESYREFINEFVDKDSNFGYTPQMTAQPPQAVIAGQQEDYQQKMRQIAEDHPEFLDALIRFTEAKAAFEQTRSRGD